MLDLKAEHGGNTAVPDPMAALEAFQGIRHDAKLTMATTIKETFGYPTNRVVLRCMNGAFHFTYYSD